MNIKRDLIQFAKTATFVLVLLLGANVVFAQWQGPPGAPPNPNAAPPINISNSAQIKEGTLTVNSENVGQNGFQVPYGRSLFGLTSDPVGFGVKAKFFGEVWADEYCDRNGANCSVPPFGGGGGGGGGGEANTGNNVGTGEGNVYKNKTGTTLNFRKILAGGGIDVSTTGDNVIISTTDSGGGLNAYTRSIFPLQEGSVMCDSGDIATGGGADNALTSTDIYASFPVNSSGGAALSGSVPAGWYCKTERADNTCFVVCLDNN